MKEKKKLSVKPVELVFYIISAVIAFVGLTSMTFGIVGHHLTVPRAENWIKTAEDAIVLDFRIWGLILVAAAAIIAVIVLVIFAHSSDRVYEKTLRRQQRLNSSLASEMEIKPAVETVEVDSNPVEPEKK